jgi:hypothetical protein
LYLKQEGEESWSEQENSDQRSRQQAEAAQAAARSVKRVSSPPNFVS